MTQLQKGDLLVDLSRNNGIVNFHKLKAAGVKGVILKSSEGATFMDKMFFKNVQGCENAGLPWGAYHFATWNNEDEKLDARQEAQFFLSIVNGSKFKPQLPLVLDIESNKPIPYTKQEMVDYIEAFLEVVDDEGFDVAIYASPGFLNSYLPENHPFVNDKLWVADYTSPINRVSGWKKIWLHQYTDQGEIDGVVTKCDLNKVL